MTPKLKLAQVQGGPALVARKDHCLRKLHSNFLGDWTLEVGSGYGYGFRLLRLGAIVAILLHDTTVSVFHLQKHLPSLLQLAETRKPENHHPSSHAN